jgi:hypothetical protein
MPPGNEFPGSGMKAVCAIIPTIVGDIGAFTVYGPIPSIITRCTIGSVHDTITPSSITH